MMLPDVNVLLNAMRMDSPDHSVCKLWLDSIVLGDEPFAISRLVLSAVVRISTHRGKLGTPLSLADAFAFCQDLLDQPHCRIVEPGERHWSIFERLCRETNTTGPRVTDAWLAALAIEHGCEWVSCDRDFARFKRLRWKLPN